MRLSVRLAGWLALGWIVFLVLWSLAGVPGLVEGQ